MSKLLFNNPFMLGFEELEESLEKLSKSDNYPPYNIEQTGDNSFNIKVAVAGFTEEDLSVTQENNQLVVMGEKSLSNSDKDEVIYLHRGISSRKFRKVFVLAEGLEPQSSRLENGILTINLTKIVIEKDIKIIKIDNKP